ncbi:MAG TPA: arginase family protein [Gemmatimonadaceae bacterium]|nr:arginase family protein [Gemmatimonadaceae bacterium]
MRLSRVDVIVVPYDSGHRGRRMGAGPGRLLDAGLLEVLRKTCDVVEANWVGLPDDFFPAEPQAAFELQRRVAGAVRRASERGAFPLVLSGNCNTAIGTIAGVGESTLGVMWFDAHGDFNTPDTTRSGFFDGMALAAATGRCWKEALSTIPSFHPVDDARIVHLGARDFDIEESRLLSSTRIEVMPAARVREGIAGTMALRRAHTRDIYLHLDMDVLDSGEGKANGYAKPGGLAAREIAHAIVEIGAAFRVRAAAITAYEPIYDPGGEVATIAVGLASAIIGAASDGD